MYKPHDWTINGRFITQRTTGVQRYAHQVTRALDLSEAVGGGVLMAPPSGAVRTVTQLRSVTVGRYGGHAWEQTVLARRAEGMLINLCNSAPVVRRRQVVCIHDANVFVRPSSYSRRFKLLYQNLLPLVARRSTVVTTVSNDAARQLAQYLPISQKDIHVLPNGHEHVFSWSAEQTTLAEAFPHGSRPFFLVIGSAAPHKNVHLATALAPLMDELGFDLVVAGGHHVAFAGTRPRTEEAEHNVYRLGYVSDADLAFLFGRARALLMPSFTEGFGLPALEAMALGCPVIASDRASLPEVCGDAALFAPPDSLETWADAIRCVAESNDLTEDLVARGRLRAQAFRWTETAAAYLALVT